MNKSKQRTTVGLLAVVAIAAAALLAVFGLPYGANNPEAFAHLYTFPTNGNTTHLHIDADLAHGMCTTPFDATVAVGSPHTVGVCLADYAPNSVNSFVLRIRYSGDPSLNPPTNINLAPTVPFVNKKCGTDSSCLDANPDANDGAGSGKLGTGWDCTGLGLAPPLGDDPATATIMDARLVCNADLNTPDQELADNPGLLATITFNALSAGVDTVDFGVIDGANKNAVTAARGAGGVARCATFPAADQVGCFGATITKVPDLGIVKTLDASTTPAIAGGQAIYDLTISGTGGTMVGDTLPVGLVYNDAATETANSSTNLCILAVVGPPNVVVCGSGAEKIVAPRVVKIVADVPLGQAGKAQHNSASLLPGDPNPSNDSSAINHTVAPASVTITKTADKASYSEGDTITWTVTATSHGPSPASSVVLSDVADANQQITACTVSTLDPCNFTATTATASLAAPLAPSGSGSVATMTITAKVVHSAGNQCVNDVTVNWADPLSASAHTAVTCLPPTVRMEKDVDQDATSIEDDSNLCLVKNPQGGLQCLTIYELVSNPGNDPNGVGAYEFELKYDHNIFVQPVIENYPTPMQGPSWLSNGGTRSVDCSMSIINENAIWWGCVSSGPTPGQTHNGTAARITLCPQPDLVNRLTPGQQNGVFSPILDENCELANVLGDPLHLANGQLAPGILPGGQVAVCSDFGVTVRILEGDLNLDGTVNVLDEQAIAFRYGATFGNLLYDPWYDLEPALKDYDIDIKDLQKVWGRQGSTCSQQGTGTIPPQVPVEIPDP